VISTRLIWIVIAAILLACIVRIVVGRAAIDARLLSACLGNRDQANRLIEHEMRQAPSLSRRQAASRALARIRRDSH
jgi:hypothetical protein